MPSGRNAPAFRKDILPQSSSTLKEEAAGPPNIQNFETENLIPRRSLLHSHNQINFKSCKIILALKTAMI
jgi:hypothetical protein